MVLITLAVTLFVLFLSLRSIASVYTDYLWFDSMNQTGVWRGVLGTKIAMAVVFVAVFFALLRGNLAIADRLAPRFRPAGPEEELVERYHAAVGGRVGLVRTGVSLLLAIIAGVPAMDRWSDWLLFRNHQTFGVQDPQFHKDVGFFVFQMPFLTFLVQWAFAALLIVLIVTAAEHYLNGGIRAQAPVQRVTPQVKAHLSVLLALLALVKLAGYWLQQFDLTTSTRGTVDGATYTDVHYQLPAVRLLALISVAAAVLFLVNIRRRGWVLPVLGLGLWAFVAVVAGSILPAFMQKVSVEPSESSKERPYITNNIEATRAAFGLAVNTNDFAASSALSTPDLQKNVATLSNIRVWDPDSQILGRTLPALQSIRDQYAISDVDVDRYNLKGALTQVNIAARELNTPGVPQSSWEATHLAYTHGYGVVMSPASAQTDTGQPSLVISDIPVVDRAGITLTRPGIYFGEELSGYVVVGSKRQEIDYTDTNGQNVFAAYQGQDGVKLGLLTRAAFALRFGDLNLLISGNITPSSRIMINRDVRARVEALAPFLSFDGDPYPAVVDGKIQWIIDGYTTSNRYPNSQRALTDRTGGLTGRFNYVRNSVKAVVDAYDGTVSLYIVDESDPIARAYRSAFPSLFAKDAPSQALKDHFRYPEDLFKVQTNMWGRYHTDNPDTFYNGSDAWVVARDPGTQASVLPTSTIPGQAPQAPAGSIPPYFQLMALPGETQQSFVLVRPFVPANSGTDLNKQVLTSFMVAKPDPSDPGRLKSYVITNATKPPGPAQVAGNLQSKDKVSQLQTLFGGQNGGSDVVYGNLLLIPVDQSLLYVRPIYVQASDNRIPKLTRIVAFFDGDVGVGTTLGEALRDIPRFAKLAALAGGAGSPGSPGGSPPPTTSPGAIETVAQLLADAERDLTDADAALRAGDLAGYQAKVNSAKAKVQRASALAGASSGSGSAPTTTAPASTTTSSTESASA